MRTQAIAISIIIIQDNDFKYLCLDNHFSRGISCARNNCFDTSGRNMMLKSLVMCEFLRKTGIFLFFCFVAIIGFMPRAYGSMITIEEPTGKDILYGPTKIVVLAEPGILDRIFRVDFFLGEYQHFVCSDHEYPFECEVDVGEQLQGWKIKAVAYDGSGMLLEETSVTTRDFSKPTRVSKYMLSDIPVRIENEKKEKSIEREKDKETKLLFDGEISCRFGNEQCIVYSVRKLSDLLQSAGDEDVAAYLEIVVDQSGSMLLSTDRIREGLEHVVDILPENTKLRVSIFSDIDSLRILTISNSSGFTTNRKIILNAVDKIRWSEGRTCLFSNVEKLIDSQPPYKIIRRVLLITDCYDTCDELASRSNIIDHARELADVIDIYRTRNYKATRSEIFKCEALAQATGGEIFDGESMSLLDALKRVISSMYATYLLDIGLPDGVKEGKARKLELEYGETGMELIYPEYHKAGLLEQLSLNMLKAGHPVVKIKALRRLAMSDDPEIISDIIKVYESERDKEVRKGEIVMISDMIGSNLLHRDDMKGKKTALRAAEMLREIDPELIGSLRPYLNVFLKKEANRRLRMRAKALID